MTDKGVHFLLGGKFVLHFKILISEVPTHNLLLIEIPDAQFYVWSYLHGKRRVEMQSSFNQRTKEAFLWTNLLIACVQVDISDQLVHVNQDYMIHTAGWLGDACTCVRFSVLSSVYCSVITWKQVLYTPVRVTEMFSLLRCTVVHINTLQYSYTCFTADRWCLKEFWCFVFDRISCSAFSAYIVL